MQFTFRYDSKEINFSLLILFKIRKQNQCSGAKGFILSLLVALCEDLLFCVTTVSILFSGTFCCQAGVPHSPQGCAVRTNEELGGCF